MSIRPVKQRLFWTFELLLLAATIAASALISSAEEWHPLSLVLVLLALALVGDWLSIETPAGHLSGALVAIVLAMGLLGPVPAMAFSLAAVVITSGAGRISATSMLNNLATFAFVPFVGGLMVVALARDVHTHPPHHLAQSTVFGLVLLSAFGVAVVLNFVLFAAHKHIDLGERLVRQVRELFLPLLPGQLAAGLLATILAVAYLDVGLPMLLGAVAVLLILRHLTVALLRSEERADQLEARSIQLASLQFGVLATLMRALALRDRTTAEHATAVARYAKALAAEVGCDEAEQELIRTAGLLHDIGKFTWSDRILHPDQLTDEDWQVIRRHPQDGATLVGTLDGYGPVADAILYHHERVDGGGYPAGLIGNEIPIASRIVAVCSTYDTMTTSDTFGGSMAPEEAMQELRRIAGTQLDSDLVDAFIALLEREGATFVTDAGGDFDSELALERRVREIAAPRSTHPA